MGTGRGKTGHISFYFIFLKRFYLCLEKGKRREKEKERNIDVRHIDWLPLARPQPDLACNPGICPDQEPNQQSFNPQAGAESTKPHQSGPNFLLEVTYELNPEPNERLWMGQEVLWAECGAVSAAQQVQRACGSTVEHQKEGWRG